jgi:hypothetical protein
MTDHGSRPVHFLKPCLIRPVSSLLLFSLTFVACGPAIHSFQVDQQTITAADSVKVNWEVSGKPTLLIHEQEAAGGANTGPGTAEAGGEKFLELTLVAQKNGKEKRQFIQVIVLPRESVDTIVFPISMLHGDTLIAAGEKNSGRWGDHFQLISVESASGRPLLVQHGGKTALLDGQNPDTTSFRGMANSGNWEIRSLLTDMEKNDPSKTPPTLRLRTHLLYKK